MTLFYCHTSAMKQSLIRLTVRFPSELLDALRQLAQQEDRSLNREIVQAVREYVKRRQKDSPC